jgi:hypothetical protein
MNLMSKIYQREHLYFREVLFHALNTLELSTWMNYSLITKGVVNNNSTVQRQIKVQLHKFAVVIIAGTYIVLLVASAQ